MGLDSTDYTGQVFNFLTVESKYGQRLSDNRTVWNVRCVCGTLVPQQRIYSLKSGQRTSCGCKKIERLIARSTRHGAATVLGRTDEYKIYTRALDRCRNPKSQFYARYGGRGIEVRFASYPDFIKELGPRPSPKHSLDRIDNDGHYEKGNVRWVTRDIQANNKSSNRHLTLNGETLTIAQWAKRLNVSRYALNERTLRQWCDECVLTIPLNKENCKKGHGCLHRASRAKTKRG